MLLITRQEGRYDCTGRNHVCFLLIKIYQLCFGTPKKRFEEAEQLSSAGIKLHGKLYGKDKSVVAIRESNKERAETILAQTRNHKGLKK